MAFVRVEINLTCRQLKGRDGNSQLPLLEVGSPSSPCTSHDQICKYSQRLTDCVRMLTMMYADDRKYATACFLYAHVENANSKENSHCAASSSADGPS
jgi:hypothetical protein